MNNCSDQFHVTNHRHNNNATLGEIMRTLIVYKSYHRMKTEKVAKTMAEAMNVQLTKVEDVRPEELAGYDLIGFGSGIYGLKHHKALID